MYSMCQAIFVMSMIPLGVNLTIKCDLVLALLLKKIFVKAFEVWGMFLIVNFQLIGFTSMVEVRLTFYIAMPQVVSEEKASGKMESSIALAV